MKENPFSMSGKVAFITGAFGGLGSHFASVLAGAGAAVALAGRRVAEGERLAAELRKTGARVCVVALDLESDAPVDRALDGAETELGPIDVLINNAGIAITRSANEISEADWRKVIDVNLTGAWLMAQAAARRMREHNGGVVVNIASILGVRVAQQVAAYCASKAALIHLTQALALEWARDRIRVNALAPGYIATALNEQFFSSEAGQALVKRIPQRRLGNPHELDGALLLLASNASAYMTGAVIAVDGGHLVSGL